MLPTSGLLKIVPVQSGVVIEKRVIEGQVVAKGDILFVISSESSSVKAGSTELAIAGRLKDRRDSYIFDLAQSARQAEIRRLSVKQKIDDLNDDVHRLANQIRLQEKRLTLARNAQSRYEELLKSNYVSHVQLQEKEADLLDQNQRLEELRRTMAASGRDISTAEAELNDLLVQKDRDNASIGRNVSALEQELTENEARREIVVLLDS